MKLEYHTDVNCGEIGKVVVDTARLDKPLTVFVAQFTHDLGGGKPFNVDASFSTLDLALRLMLHCIKVRNKHVVKCESYEGQDFTLARIFATTYLPDGTKTEVELIDNDSLVSLLQIQGVHGWEMLYE